jgi:hypothetical protein
MMIKLKIIVFSLLFGLSNQLIAQSGISHELGVIAGPLEFRSDYGQRNRNSNNEKNSGFGIGVVHYLSFSYNTPYGTYFSEHFRVRNELSYSRTDLKHFGEWIDESRTSLAANQLRSMYGSTEIVNLGTQLEFNPWAIHRYERSLGIFAPYVSLGAQIGYYTAKANSTLGQLGNPVTTPLKYLVPSDGHPNGFSNESKPVLSAVVSIGTRYKLNSMADLLLDIKWQYYNSDWVDGLNPNKDLFKENKSNDYMVWVTLGYVIYTEH